MALRDADPLLSSPDNLPRDLAEKLFQRSAIAKLYLGFFEQVESEVREHRAATADSDAFLTQLENEIPRLKEESRQGRYDLHRFFDEQINKATPSISNDVARFHAEHKREDLFELRACSVSQRSPFTVELIFV